MIKPKKAAPTVILSEPHPRQFVVQHLVDIKARDRENSPFLLDRVWNTIARADSQRAAEQVSYGLAT